MAIAGLRQPFPAVRFSQTLGQTLRVAAAGRVDRAVAFASWLSESVSRRTLRSGPCLQPWQKVMCSVHCTVVLAGEFVVATCPPQRGSVVFTAGVQANPGIAMGRCRRTVRVLPEPETSRCYRRSGSDHNFVPVISSPDAEELSHGFRLLGMTTGASDRIFKCCETLHKLWMMPTRSRSRRGTWG